ncbi:hypothetical protein BU14_1729s0001 [Porphyra umbilicalis]|uniref:Uncharacterized protein n=1 Tax=Porphyra umbilicalis TaxID=2786 RepID=A0A1X6NL71_PORUM|nr:hypothetical protein BU14_1729s0001 [Porphyra umbilicalis]|eukprot:OSX69216.1 hypothetical protein BU14_1729s0001 [Porphyra umbilicalis]
MTGKVVMASLAALAALVSTVAAATTATVAYDGSVCASVPIHKILAAPGGVYRLRDGRELKAKVVTVGGCPASTSVQTGAAYPAADKQTNYTAFAYANRNTECLTGATRGGSAPPTYKAFQAVVIEANGFRFSTALVMEGIDAQAEGADPPHGRRETMTSLGMAGGAVVRPDVTTMPGALVSVEPFKVPKAALAEVGFPSAQDLTVDAAEYTSLTENKNCAFMDDEADQCKAFVSYTDPIDRLLIAYAGTQPSSDGTTDGVAFVSALTLGCGCQCAEKAGPTRTIVPLPGRTDRCRSVPNTQWSFVCDFRGALWCETALSTRWLLTEGGEGACVHIPSLIQRRVSPYAPAAAFG